MTIEYKLEVLANKIRFLFKYDENTPVRFHYQVGIEWFVGIGDYKVFEPLNSVTLDEMENKIKEMEEKIK